MLACANILSVSGVISIVRTVGVELVGQVFKRWWHLVMCRWHYCVWSGGLLLLVGLYSTPTLADQIYRWTDENGKVHFGDQPHVAADQAQVETLTVKQPQRQPDAKANSVQQRENEQWFQERIEQREAKEARARKARAKIAAANKKKRESCDKARHRLADLQRELKARQRAGIKPKHERKIEATIETYEIRAEREC